jgi:hypothetical protein
VYFRNESILITIHDIIHLLLLLLLKYIGKEF